MIIQHNISALNAHRQMGVNNASTSKNLEKLSSGYKINRAGDDAAGLAISEKMRGQIRGLAMAEQNASNGISLIQTAEGGLNETHAILQRMRELAVQSANGTYKDEVDRENLDKEVNALKEEIDRIATSTHYNGINLLDGSLGGAGSSGKVTGTGKIGGLTTSAKDVTLEGLPKGFVVEFTATQGSTGYAAADASGITVGYDDTNKKVTIDLQTVAADGSTLTYTQAMINEAIAAKSATTSALEGVKMTSTDSIVTGAATAKANIGSIVMGGKAPAASTKADDVVGSNTNFKLVATRAGETDIASFTFAKGGAGVESVGKSAAGAVTVTLADDKEYTASDITALLAAHDIDFKAQFSGKQMGDDLVDSFGSTQLDVTDGTGSGSDGLIFQIGANGSADQRVSLSVSNMDSSSIGVANVSVSSQDKAKDAIEAIDTAINTVSGTRADLGALQNRLEHTLNNLGVTKENLTAAESSIRDVDMAKEMMEFTKNNILVQASQAMLAQANQLPQGVLSLLR